MLKNIKIVSLLLMTVFNSVVFAQDDNTDDEGNTISASERAKSFHVGLYIGAYFANNYTAGIYDGYGIDINGNRNDFENSLMYQKIVLQYGYLNNPSGDLIAQALKVDNGQWSFNAGNMPTNMRYSPSFIFGLQGRYSVDKKNAILLNVNAVQINSLGDFTIHLTNPPVNANNYFNADPVFPIKGVEQRLMFQVGYQGIITKADKINLLLEGGLNGTLAKVVKNEILINTLDIELTAYNLTPGYTGPYPVKRPVGFGLGAFAGTGFSLTMNPKCTIQLVYDLSYEEINMGTDPARKFQHAVALRAYYNM